MLETLPPSASSAASQPRSPGLRALLLSAAFAPLPSTAWLRVTGSDRVRWLNGMATNSIQALRPGEGNYNFFLNAQGRIQGDAYAFLFENYILLQTGSQRLDALQTMLDRFIIMDDVELAPETAGEGLLIAGPNAVAALQAAGAAVIPDRPLQVLHDEKLQADIIRMAGPLVPRFEVWSSAAVNASLRSALAANEVEGASAEDLEVLRMLEGTPRIGLDIRDRDLPQETAQTRALHFSKGCYLGQEIVERIRSRGNVHRTFTGFLLQGELPPAGAALHAPDAPDRPAGELTSVARIEAVDGAPVLLALGYVRREALERGTPFSYPGGTATPSPLPFHLFQEGSETHV